MREHQVKIYLFVFSLFIQFGVVLSLGLSSRFEMYTPNRVCVMRKQRSGQKDEIHLDLSFFRGVAAVKT